MSALGYTAGNMCLRSLSTSADPLWTMSIKESVALVVVGPWVLRRMLRGECRLPRVSVLVGLAAVGAAVQLFGNLNVLAAFGTIGLAVTVPAVSAVNLSAGAVLGWMVLGERVSVRSAAAIGCLILSITLLRLDVGADVRSSLGDPARTSWALAGVCLAGFVYAVMGVSIRKSVAHSVPPSLVVVIIPGMAALTLGPLAWARHGLDGLLAIEPGHLALMLLAGLFNVAAFFAYTSALRWITVVQASVVSAAQVTMAALAGVWFFSEPPREMLWLGVGLTIVGILLNGGAGRTVPTGQSEQAPRSASAGSSAKRDGDLLARCAE